ncbi:MAG: sensor domain-containing diguanylate cyclase [Eubacterium sp.]|nr:sensor domain-containing diguanylate cyclase [Eubacterium sp.]
MEENGKIFSEEEIKKLEDENRLYKAILDNTHAMIFWKDKDRHFVGANKAFLDYYGLESEEAIIGKTDEDMNFNDDPLQYMNDEEIVLYEGKSVIRSEGKTFTKGHERDIVSSKVPVFDDGQIVGLVGNFRDVTDTNRSFKEVIDELNRVRDKIKHFEFYDQLTNVLNRSGVYEVAADFEEKFLEEQKDFAAVYLDIDDFRNFNESYGYQFGDDLLVKIARTIESTLDEECALARLGSDVFIVLVRFDDESEIKSLMKRMSHAVRDIKKVDGYNTMIGFVYGYAKYSDFMDIDRLFLEADKKLHDSKKKNDL